MINFLKQVLGQGDILSWMLAIIASVGALAALLNALWPYIQAYCRARSERRKTRKEPPSATAEGQGAKPVEVHVKLKKRSLLVSITFLIIAAIMFEVITTPPQISVSEERTNIAWDFFKRGEPDPVSGRPPSRESLNRAIQIADTVIEDLKGAADLKQRSLLDDGVPPPPTGEVTDAQRKEILAYGSLNDVATSLWIKGRSFQYMNRTNEMISAYSALTNYPHARTWDPKGWFWSPMEDAEGRLNSITIRN